MPLRRPYHQNTLCLPPKHCLTRRVARWLCLVVIFFALARALEWRQLAELHRKYRIMEGNRRQYSEDSQNVIRRQRAAIDKLKADNLALKQELALETRADFVAPPHVQDEITRLQDEADSYTRKIELERRRVEELEKTIGVLTMKAMEQRKRMGGVNSAKESSVQVAKQVKVLENRLDKALVKFNEALAHNKSLRATIDNLRRERVVFDQIYKKLERELHERKKEMANVIEISNIAYEARDQAQNEMAALRAQADKEQAAFEAEWRELGRIIERDRKAAEEKRKADIHGKLTMAEERGLRKKLVAGNWGLLKDKAGHQIVADKASTYEDVFNKIQEATGISDIDDLVNSFIQAEDDNFSLFNYVNELNQELEKLDEGAADLRAELDKYRGQGVNSDNQRKKLLQDMEARLQATEAKTETYEHKHSHAMRTLNALKQGIMSIFGKIGCQVDSSLREALGDAGISEDNMMAYLGIIEQRTNEVLMQFSGVQRSQAAAAGGEDAQRQPSQHSVLGAGPAVAAGSTGILAIDPPTTNEEYLSEEESEEEVDDRPLTRDELTERTMRNLSKTGGRVRKKSSGRKA